MKKFRLTFVLFVVLTLSSISVAYAAGYSKLDNLTPGQAGYVLAQALFSQTGNYIYDVSCTAYNYSFKVVVSYDSLSDICTDANSVGVG